MDYVYLITATGGGLFFLIQLVLQFTGIFDGDSGGSDIDIDSGSSDTDTSGDGSDLSFRYLSLQSFSAYFMIFGLTGLALHRQSHFPHWISIIVSVLAGLATLKILSWIYKIINSLQSTGNLDLTHVEGSQGEVYAQIPEKGTGQVQIRIEGRIRTFDAQSCDGTFLESGTPVRVVSMSSDHRLLVERVI